MPNPPEQSEPRLLVASSETELVLRLTADLEPRGVVVSRAYTGREAVERAHEGVDACLIDWTLSDMSGFDVCEQLRRGGKGSFTPILLATGVLPGREERLHAMRSGAWDIVIHPIDPEELQLKLDRYVEAKRTTEWALSECPIDPITGLFTETGTLRQAQGVVSLAARQDAAVACVVLEAQLNGLPGRLTDLTRRLGDILRATARASDVIGRTGPTTFIIVAPATPPEGAVHLIERLVNAIQRDTRERHPGHGIKLRAGYEAVSSARQTPLEADELLKRAVQASHGAWFGSEDRWVRRHSGPPS